MTSNTPPRDGADDERAWRGTAGRARVLSDLSMLELQEASMYARRLQTVQRLRVAAEAEYLAANPAPEGRKAVVPDSVYADVVAEICAVRRVGRRQVEAEVAEASRVIEYLPGMFELMLDGLVAPRQARAIADEVAPLVEANEAAVAYERARYDPECTPEVRAALCEAVVAAGAALVEYEDLALELTEGRSAASLRDRCRRLVARVLGQGAEERQRAARAGRRVWLRDVGDGMCELTALLSADIAVSIHDRLTEQAAAVARTARAAAPIVDARDGGGSGEAGAGDADAGGAGATAGKGAAAGEGAGAGAVPGADGRTFEQIRADVLADLLLTSEPSEVHASGRGIDATVAITVPALTLLGADTEPVTANGSTPIAMDAARRYAAGASSWLRVLTDPITGVARAAETYRPTAAQRALVGTRDVTCRFPGCKRAARRCDIDHTTAWAEGGRTDVGNLESLCRWHHSLKHSTAWEVRHDPDRAGQLIWTAPSGREYPQDAPPVGPVFTPSEQARLRCDPPGANTGNTATTGSLAASLTGSLAGSPAPPPPF